MTTTTAPRQTGWIADASTFGARLALIRQRMGWGNVAEAAKACGVPVASWRNWERDNREPHRITTVAKQIATATGCSYEWLVLGPNGGDGGVNEHYRPLSERVIARVGEDRARPNSRVLNASTRPGSSGQPRRRRPRQLGPSSRSELTRV